MSEKLYIPMKNFSEDKYRDSADPTKGGGIFQLIKNYIPSPRQLKVRKGVSDFIPPPTIDPACILWLKFNGAGYKDCEVNGANYMVSSSTWGSAELTTDSYEGSHALHCSASMNQGIGLGKWTASLPPSFPGVEGSSSTTNFMICCWMHLTNAGGGKGIWGKRISGGGDHINLNRDDSTTLTFRVYTTIPGYRNVSTGAGAYATDGGWVHVGCWYSTVLKTMGIRVYDDDSSTVVKNVTASWGTSNLPYQINFQSLGLGGTHYTNGYLIQNPRVLDLDDYYVLDGLPATEAAILTKIDNIRDGNHY